MSDVTYKLLNAENEVIDELNMPIHNEEEAIEQFAKKHKDAGWLEVYVTTEVEGKDKRIGGQKF